MTLHQNPIPEMKVQLFMNKKHSLKRWLTNVYYLYTFNILT